MAGQKLKESDYAGVEAQLKDLLRRLVFGPIVDLLAPRNAQVRAARAELRNAKSSPVVAALRSGRIQYDMEGTFSGEFSAAISKALRGYGARFDKRTSTFAVLPQSLPVEVLQAASEYADTAKELHDGLMARLGEMERALEGGGIASDPGLHSAAKAMVARTGREFQADYGDALGISTTSQGAQARLARMYVDSLTPPIKDFSKRMVAEIREIVADNARQGYRFDNLIQKIQGRYSVTQSKAEFLAQNETSIFVSRARAERFGDAGIREYVWDTAGDAEVRKGHRELDGRVFDFRIKAPAQYMSCGEPCNPGEDYRCRCIARPIMPAPFGSPKELSYA